LNGIAHAAAKATEATAPEATEAATAAPGRIAGTAMGARAGFRSLHDAWADTTTPHGRLMLTVLGGLAEFERELIKARTGDGRARAKSRGVKFGRPR
jgi:hypothetical protein